MSTRPRIEFDENGSCNACQWYEDKKSIDWNAKENEFKKIVSDNVVNDAQYDCIVPVSGGKDGSYIAYQVKEKYNLNPLTVTVRPPLELALGRKNLDNFINSGFNHIHITPNIEVMRKINKEGFMQLGQPYYGWLIAINTGVIRVAEEMNIPLVIYAEDGELEYGGSTENINNTVFTAEYIKRVFFEGGYNKVLSSVDANDADMYFFTFPKNSNKISLTHWSYYENWDPYRNYLIAKEHCGLEENTAGNSRTFTNFAQNDQKLYALHTYLMYLKFGFGRATQDAGIEIRRGAMTREQAVNLVRLYDGILPEEYINDYLEYYKMSLTEFNEVLDRWANKDLFEKEKGVWRPKFMVQ